MTMKKNKAEKKVELEMQADKQVIARDKTCTRILEINITPPVNDDNKDRAPLNLSLVVDRSGSMEGEKLHYVKQAAAHVVDLLDEGDRASITIYDDKVKTIFPSELMTKENKRKAKAQIQEVVTGASTFLFGGWLEGCENVAKGMTEGTVNRTLLLTDGLANVGITSASELATHARELYRRGVATSCFGAGAGYDEHLLESMSNNGGGNFHFLETLNAIPLVFEREFKELISISLRDVEVSIQLPKWVTADVSAGFHAEKVKDSINIAPGSLYSGKKQAIYLKLHFEKDIEAKEMLLPISVRGKGDGNQIVEEKQTITFKVVSSKEEDKAEDDRALMERFALVDMADRTNDALKLEKAGDRAGAARKVRTSMELYQREMSPVMNLKYATMADEMGVGLNEMDRKRYHQEEYANKRGRDNERDFLLTLVNGHLVARINEQSVLIDTGIPISLGNPSGWHFLNEIHQLSQDYMGVTLQYLSKMVGTPIDIVLGADILKKHHVIIDLAKNSVSFSTRALFHSVNSIKMETLLGTPIATLTVSGKECQMFVDTGAKLSYVDHGTALKFTPIGKEGDFYPGIGEFETDVFEIPFQLGVLKFNLRCGVLPPLLEKTLMVTGKCGIVGTELYQKYMVDLAFPEGTIYLKEPQ
jgi:Ca-activated chloride channel family protein